MSVAKSDEKDTVRKDIIQRALGSMPVFTSPLDAYLPPRNLTSRRVELDADACTKLQTKALQHHHNMFWQCKMPLKTIRMYLLQRHTSLGRYNREDKCHFDMAAVCLARFTHLIGVVLGSDADSELIAHTLTELDSLVLVLDVASLSRTQVFFTLVSEIDV